MLSTNYHLIFFMLMVAIFNNLSCMRGHHSSSIYADQHAPNTPIAHEQPNSGPSIFLERSPLLFKLRGSFSEAFKPLANADQKQNTKYFAGAVAYQDKDHCEHQLPGKIKVRGHASRTVCSFPKLQYKFLEQVTDKKSPFYGLDSFKLATHCGDNEEMTNYGKLIGEKPVYREAFVYDLLKIFAMPGLQVRPAETTYIDTGGEHLSIQRNSFILETPEAMARRLGVQLLKDDLDDNNGIGYDPKYYQKIEPFQLASIYLFNILIGNTDFEIVRDRGALIARNILLFKNPVDNKVIPVTYDFDLAIMVSGKILIGQESVDTKPTFVTPSKIMTIKQITKQLVNFQQKFANSAVGDVVNHFRTKSADVEELLDKYMMDDEGKKLIKLRAKAFFQILDHGDPLKIQ